MSKSLLYRALNKVNKIVFDSDWTHYARSFSQEGEDMVLRSLVGRKESGFYVDVGAHHPTWYSNTHHFYELGWRGINIDANPDSMKMFRKLRRRDKNIEGRVGDSGELEFFQYKDAAFNTFDGDLVEQRKGNSDHFPDRSTIVNVQPLSEILNQHLTPGTSIDFMNIDVEGMDHEVLESNDWGKYKPGFIMVESYGRKLPDIKEDKTYQFLVSEGYELMASTRNTLIFQTNGK